MSAGNVYLKNLNTEGKLIICYTKDDGCLREEAIDLLKLPINWESLTQEAWSHRVIPYIYKSIKSLDIAEIPDGLVQEVKATYMGNTFKSIMLSQELKQILSAFNAGNVDTLILKGAFLAEQVYPEPSFRSYSDIDILVHEQDFESAEQLLVCLGFKLIEENQELHENEGRTQVHYKKSNGCVVDLHAEAMNNKWYPSVTKYFNETLWPNAKVIDFNGNQTHVLSAEDLVIYHCIHLSVHHNFHKLIWFKDIDQVVRSAEKIEWDEVIKRAERYNLRTYCYYSLLLTKALFETPIPDSTLEKLRPRYLAARLFERLIQKENLLGIYKDRRGKAQQVWMLLRDTFFERISALWWRNMPSVQWYLHYYPFLPRIREAYYYPIYPFLTLMRLFIRPNMK